MAKSFTAMIHDVLVVLGVVGLVGSPYFVRYVSANECTEVCDNGISIPAHTPIRLCGSDGVTHYTSYEAAVSSRCYFNCNVAALYEGPCGCPNDCFEASGQGFCENSQCVCKGEDVWGGPDCGSLGSKNTCSGHGKLVHGEEFNSCVCDEGYTGFDCSSEVFKLGSMPYGDIFNKPAYSSLDLYNDSHPVFNISVVASIRIEMDSTDYLAMINPATIYSKETFRPAKIHFDNNRVRESFTNVGIRAKGAFARMDLKKGLDIKLNEFVKGQKLMGVQQLGLNAGTGGGDSLLRNVLYADFARAMGTPVQRSSYATVFINDVFEGIYLMQEDINEDFISNRIEGDSGGGNMMKVCGSACLHYYGGDQATYEKMVTYYPSGDPQPKYEQSFGDSDWTDYISFVKFLNASSDHEFQRSLSQWVDVDLFLKTLIVESFMMSSGTYAHGHNYQFYHLQPNPQYRSVSDHRWMLVESDFDDTFEFVSPGVADARSPGIYDYFVKTGDPTDPKHYNPLSVRLLSIPALYRLYVEMYVRFVSVTYGMTSSTDGKSTSPQNPADRFGALLNLVQPWINKDKFWQISCGETGKDFRVAAELTMKNLPLRYKSVTDELITASQKI
jgi:hypothetical protein